MKKLKTLYIAILTLSLISCNTLPPAKGLPFKYGNDCLPQAIVMVEALKEKNIEAEVLCITTDKWGHSVSMYFYPKGQNQMWIWDTTWQSIRIRAWRDDPYSVANAWLKTTRHVESAKFAEYLK